MKGGLDIIDEASREISKDIALGNGTWTLDKVIRILHDIRESLVFGEDFSRKFACEGAYHDAMSCLEDARFICAEREYHGVCALVEHSIRCVKVIGSRCDINGIDKIGMSGGAE